MTNAPRLAAALVLRTQHFRRLHDLTFTVAIVGRVYGREAVGAMGF